jgi:vacuolar-type H+-ATPase subunit I/STV1
LERLVTTSDAAKLLNLSIQGIHYRIKKGQLRSKKQNGRVFVYIDEKEVSKQKITQIDDNQYQTIIELKDQQLKQIQKTLEIVIKQYKKEIKRLEKNQNKMLEVFNSEIQLLKMAFNEMREIYKIENKNSKFEFMSVSEFFILMRKYNKNDKQIKELIFNRIKTGDKRFIFNKNTKELYILKSDFKDII